MQLVELDFLAHLGSLVLVHALRLHFAPIFLLSLWHSNRLAAVLGWACAEIFRECSFADLYFVTPCAFVCYTWSAAHVSIWKKDAQNPTEIRYWIYYFGNRLDGCSNKIRFNCDHRSQKDTAHRIAEKEWPGTQKERLEPLGDFHFRSLPSQVIESTLGAYTETLFPAKSNIKLLNLLFAIQLPHESAWIWYSRCWRIDPIAKKVRRFMCFGCLLFSVWYRLFYLRSNCFQLWPHSIVFRQWNLDFDCMAHGICRGFGEKKDRRDPFFLCYWFSYGLGECLAVVCCLRGAELWNNILKLESYIIHNLRLYSFSLCRSSESLQFIEWLGFS